MLESHPFATQNREMYSVTDVQVKKKTLSNTLEIGISRYSTLGERYLYPLRLELVGRTTNEGDWEAEE